jgi:hypothetical protein
VRTRSTFNQTEGQLRDASSAAWVWQVEPDPRVLHARAQEALKKTCQGEAMELAAFLKTIHSPDRIIEDVYALLRAPFPAMRSFTRP